MKILHIIFRSLFIYCLSLTNNDLLAVILFTIITKIIILPITIFVHFNSIKMVKMYPDLNRIKANYYGDRDGISEKQYELYKKNNYHPLLDIFPTVIQLIVLVGVSSGFPENDSKTSLLLSIIAASSSLLMCYTQNKSNVLQSEQSKINKISVLIFSVGLSLYLGLTSSRLIVFYWICSNIASIAIMYILNYFINPKNYIDYDELENSKKELEETIKYNESVKKYRSKALIERENKDYKRFIKYPNKQIVFYSEKNGFYKYYRDTIDIILKKTNIIIHYISSDPEDEIFELANDNFQTYYIDEKLMILMMKMDADVVVMTTPDLQNYYLKRSMVRDDIEYIYIDHGFSSMNLTYHYNALANYDTIFVQNEAVYNELKEQELKFGFKSKKIIKSGYALIDNMIKSYSAIKDKEKTKTILIAPSWQKDNIMDLCIDNLLTNLLQTNYKIIVRPHPQYVRHCKEKIESLNNKYKDYPNFELQIDFSSNDTVYNSDVVITDWSGIAFEYSFTTLKPVLFINTPMKVINEKYMEIDSIPFDIILRNKIGKSLEIIDINKINDCIESLLKDDDYSSESIKRIRDSYLYNIDSSAKVNAKYLVDTLIEKYEDSITKCEQILEKKNNESFFAKLLTSLICFLFFFLTVFYFSPLEVFFTSNSDFPFPINNVWWIMLLLVIISSVVCSLAASLIPNSINKFINYSMFLCGLCCYIQETLLNGHVKSLDSDTVFFNKNVIATNIVLWVIMLIFGYGLYMLLNKKKINYSSSIKYISLVLVVMQLVGLLSVSNNIDNNKYSYLSSRNEFEISSNENTIVFILDYCDGDFVKSALDKYPDLFSELDGFTYYTDCTSTYSRTYPSIPYLLTHVSCYYDKPFNDYIDFARENDSVISDLKKDGYNVGIFTDSELISKNAKNNIDNYQEYDVSSLDIINIKQLIKQMSVLSMYRSTPYILKEFFYNNYPIDMNSVLSLNEKCIENNDTIFYKELINNGLTVSKDYNKSFRFYHLASTHSSYNKNVEKDNNASKEDTIYASFKIINEYINQLKEKRLYDTARIIITADHGDPHKQLNGEICEPINIIMLEKLENKNGDIIIDNTAVCHDYLFELHSTNFKKSLGEISKEKLSNERNLYYTIINDETYREQNLKRYTIVGNSDNFNNWHDTNDIWDIKYSMYKIDE